MAHYQLPIVLKVILGFCSVEFAAPPPKFHNHDVGTFVERSKKFTDPPTGIIIGLEISALKSATGGAFTAVDGA